MKRLSCLTLALLAACASDRQASRPAPGLEGRAGRQLLPSEALATLSRALDEIDAALRRGEGTAERERREAQAAARPQDQAARFLAVYARPHDEATWGELRGLARAMPTSALPAVGMARLYLEWRVPDQVPRLLGAMGGVDAGNWLVDQTRAQADEQLGRVDDALAGYRRVVEVDPCNAAAHTGLARLALRAGDAAGARREAEAALAGLPGHAPALALLADLASTAGDSAATLEAWKRLTAANPSERDARVRLAGLLQQAGDLAGARDQWAAALALKEEAGGLATLADLCRTLGDQPCEQRALERFSAVDPGGARWGRIAEIRLADGDEAGAEKALRRALQQSPKDPKLLAAMGRLQQKQGHPLEAMEAFRAAGEEGSLASRELARSLSVEKVGRGDAAAVQKAVGALVDRTYRARLKAQPGLSGQLTLRVTVDVAGLASQVEIVEDSVHDEEVRACAYWNLKDATFPPQKPGRTTFTWSFSPGR